MTTRSHARPPTRDSRPEVGLHAQAALLADALLAQGVEREQAARLAIAMVEACAARRHETPRRPS